MAYSGTQTFNLQIEEIIEEALERCQLEARSGYDLKTILIGIANRRDSETAND